MALSKEVKGLKAQFETLKSEVQTLKGENVRLTTENKTLIRDVQQLRTEVRTLKSEVRSVSRPSQNFYPSVMMTPNIGALRLFQQASTSSSTTSTRKRFKKNTEVSSNWTGKTHPLLIEVVVKELTEYMDFETLKQARVVCSKWNEILFPRFKNQATIRIQLDKTKTILEFLHIFDPSSLELRKFNAIRVISPNYFDFPRFRNWMSEYGKNLQSVCIDNDEVRKKMCLTNRNIPKLKMTNLKILLKSWCPNTQILKLNLGIHMDTADILDVNQYNLQDLVLGTDATFTLLSDTEMEISTHGLLNIIKPTLKTLALVSKCDRGNIFDIMTVNGLNVIENLTNLNLERFRLNLSTFIDLADVEFRNLQELHIGNVMANNNTDIADIRSTLETLLINVAPSLKQLYIGQFYSSKYSVDRPEINNVTFPTMENVKLFVNKNFVAWNSQSIEFVMKLPNLEVCKLQSDCNYDCTHAKQLFHPDLVHQSYFNVTKFELQCWIKDLLVIENIVECFPNLKSLSIKLSLITLVETMFTIATLQHLDELQLELHAPALDFEEAIKSHLPSFPALTSLIVTLSPILQIDSFLSVEGASKGFLLAKVLKHLEFRNFEINRLEFGRLKTKLLKGKPQLVILNN